MYIYIYIMTEDFQPNQQLYRYRNKLQFMIYIETNIFI